FLNTAPTEHYTLSLHDALPILKNAKCCSKQQWEDQQRQNSSDENAPHEDRQTEHGHARCTHRQNGGDHVDSGKHGTDTGCANTDDPHVCADTWGVNTVSQRHVHGPTEVSCATWGQETRQHNKSANGRDPETE